MAKYYNVRIRWDDDPNDEQDVIIKEGDIEEDNDNIFWYVRNVEELESLKTPGIVDFKVLHYSESTVPVSGTVKLNLELSFQRKELSEKDIEDVQQKIMNALKDWADCSESGIAPDDTFTREINIATESGCNLKYIFPLSD